MKIVVAVVLAALLLTPAAFAGGGSVLSGYGGEASPSVVKVKTGPTTVSAVQGTQDTLPFTGADLGWIVVAGGALLVAGVAARRLGSDKR